MRIYQRNRSRPDTADGTLDYKDHFNAMVKTEPSVPKNSILNSESLPGSSQPSPSKQRRTKRMQAKTSTSNASSKTTAISAAELSAYLIPSAKKPTEKATVSSSGDSKKQSLVDSVSLVLPPKLNLFASEKRNVASKPTKEPIIATNAASAFGGGGEDSSPIKSLVKTFHELKQSGENQLLNDELEYLFDGFDGRHPLNLRRYSMLEFTQRCIDSKEFERISCGRDFIPRLCSLIITEVDIVMRICVGIVLFLTLTDPLVSEMLLLQDGPNVCEYLMKMLSITATKLGKKEQIMISELQETVPKNYLRDGQELHAGHLAFISLHQLVQSASKSVKLGRLQNVLASTKGIETIVDICNIQLRKFDQNKDCGSHLHMALEIFSYCSPDLDGIDISSLWNLVQYLTVDATKKNKEILLTAMKIAVNLTHIKTKGSTEWFRQNQELVLRSLLVVCYIDYGAQSSDTCLLGLASIINLIENNSSFSKTLLTLELWEMINSDDLDDFDFEKLLVFTTYLAFLIGTLLTNENLDQTLWKAARKKLPDNSLDCLKSPLETYAAAHQSALNESAEEISITTGTRSIDMVQSFLNLSSALSIASSS